MRPTAGSSTADPGAGGEQPRFLFDLGDPLCYLAAERVMSVLPELPEWDPVHAAAIGLEPVPADPADVARWAEQLQLLPVQMPAEMPQQTEAAMLAATYAKAVGRTVNFSLAAFRQAFAGGRDLNDEATLLLAGAACEMHPAALLKGMQLRSTRERLERAGHRAQAAEVTHLPAILLADGRVFCGPGSVEDAAAALVQAA